MWFRRCVRFFPALFFMVVIFLFSSIPGEELQRTATPIIHSAPQAVISNKSVEIPWLKIGHMIGYSGLGAALLYSFQSTALRAEAYSIAVTALYALTDEIHQGFVPGRHPFLNDIVIDVAAACAAICLIRVARFLFARVRA